MKNVFCLIIALLTATNVVASEPGAKTKPTREQVFAFLEAEAQRPLTEEEKRGGWEKFEKVNLAERFGTDFSGLDLSEMYFHISRPIIASGIDFSHCNLRGSYLSSHTEFVNCNFAHVNFSKVHFAYFNFVNADLSNANLQEANLAYAQLRNANLNNTDFTNARLRGADFTGADLNGAIFDGADVYGALFTNVKGIDYAQRKALEKRSARWHYEIMQYEHLFEGILALLGFAVLLSIPVSAVIFSIIGLLSVNEKTWSFIVGCWLNGFAVCSSCYTLLMLRMSPHHVGADFYYPLFGCIICIVISVFLFPSARSRNLLLYHVLTFIHCTFACWFAFIRMFAGFS
jgi:uncharacterized protein YjbI with pentapeptide repeats